MNVKFKDATLKNTAKRFELLRQQMVTHQLQNRGIEDPRVLAALSKVPRHLFVDSFWQDLAYRDRPLPIGHGQTISQPFIVAYMTQVAEITPRAKVLEVGTGCGYQTAILGEIAQQVYSVEIIPELAKKARLILNQLGYDNIEIKIGDGYQGWAEKAPYNVIMVTAAPKHLPETLVTQLAMDGKMVVPVGTWDQRIVVLTKTKDGIIQDRTLPVCFVPMRRKRFQ